MSKLSSSPDAKALLDLMREHYFAADKQPGKVSMDATMQQLGADDLDLVETAMAAEDRFGVDIPDNIVSPSMTPRTLLEYIKAVKAAEEWKKRNYNIKPVNKSNMNKSANMTGLEKVAGLSLGIMVDPKSLVPDIHYENVPKLDEMNSADVARKNLDNIETVANDWRLPAAGGVAGAGIGAALGTAVSNAAGKGTVSGLAVGGGLGALLGALAARHIAQKSIEPLQVVSYNNAVTKGLAAAPDEAAQLYGTKDKTWQEKYDEALRKQRGF